MAKVRQLLPGQQVKVPHPEGETVATFIGRITPHPIYPALDLVVWKMPAGHPVGEWSHDALSPHQDVGEVVLSDRETRTQNLRQALFPGGS